VVRESNPRDILCGFVGRGIFRSLNAGTTWTDVSNGISYVYVRSVSVHPNDPNWVAAAFEGFNSGGVYISSDGGLNWFVPQNLPAERVNRVVIDPVGDIYAALEGPTTIAPEGVYKSTDGGVTWIGTGPDLGSFLEVELEELIISPNNPELLFASGNNFGVNGFDEIIYRTTTGGDSGWVLVYQNLANNSIQSMGIDPSSGDSTLYAGRMDSFNEPFGGIIKSTDGGENWVEMNAGFPSVKNVYSLALDTQDPLVLYVGLRTGSTTGDIYKTTDGGSNWNLSGFNLTAYALTIHPDTSAWIYSGTWGDSIFHSTDWGSSWVSYSEGLSCGVITCFAFDSRVRRNLYAGTPYSIFVREVPLPVGIDEESSDFGMRSAEFGLKQNQPNPFNKLTAISYELQASSHTTLQIFDLAGRLVETLVDEDQKSGVYQIEWDGRIGVSPVRSGIYFYRIVARIGQAEEFKSTKKLILLR
jgi:photosystem II stability/assembly factor-like uncharacterized protein